MNYSCLIVKVRRSRWVNELIETRGLDIPDNFNQIYCVTNKPYSDAEIVEIKNGNYIKQKTLLAINGFSHIYINYSLSKEFLADNKIDATYNILKARNYIKLKKNWVLIQQPPKSNRQVYAFKLTKDVLLEDRFNIANPTCDTNKPLLYIGETSKTITDRFNQHTENNGMLAANFMRNYGIRNFNEANWTPNIFKETGINPENKNDFNSKFFERKIALKLRELGYGVWYN